MNVLYNCTNFFLAGASPCDLHQNFLCSTIIFNTSVELMREIERERERERVFMELTR